MLYFDSASVNLQPSHKTKERTLVWDIETSPIISFNWGIWEQNAIEVIEDFQILSVAWQWVGEKKVHCLGQDDFKGYKPGVNNDTKLVSVIRDLLDECDTAVAHNGDQFDVKKVNARMMIRGLAPPSPYKQIDTKKIAKRVGAFTSNRLKHLAKDLNVNQKGDPGGFGTWKGCMAGDPKAWKRMKKYNKLDIPPLLDLYLKFRPWDKQATPLNVLLDKPSACPKCGLEDQMQSRGTTSTKTGSFQRFQCMNCRGWSRARLAEKRLDKVEYVS